MSVEAAANEVRRRMASQMPEEDKAKLADFVIDNSASRAQAGQRVQEIWRELTHAARAR
jgi:dephospho-CoA kinase